MNNKESKKTFDLDEIEEQESNHEEGQQTDQPKKKKNNIYDMARLLLEEMGYKFLFNELSGREEIILEDKAQPVPMTDRIFDQMYVEFLKRNIKMSASNLQRIVRGGVATPYHPVKQYFDQLPKWDGEDHIRKLAETIIIDDYGQEMSKIWPVYLKKWLVAVAAQATIESATNHTCLVLMGAQGKGKTTWLNNLCPEELQHLRFTGHIRTNDKDSLNLLAEKFLINIDDQLDLIKDLRYLKSMFTVDKVNNRKAFDKYNPNRPRIGSFVASVNSAEFLTDDQNRRYLVFHARTVDFEALKQINKTQVWAQVKYSLDNGFRYWFNTEENETISQVNEAFRIKSEEEEMLTLYFEPDDEGTAMMQTEILHFLQAHSTSRLNSKQLTVALKKRGFVKKSIRVQSKKSSKKTTSRWMYMVKKLEPKEIEDQRDLFRDQLLEE